MADFIDTALSLSSAAASWGVRWNTYVFLRLVRILASDLVDARLTRAATIRHPIYAADMDRLSRLGRVDGRDPLPTKPISTIL